MHDLLCAATTIAAVHSSAKIDLVGVGLNASDTLIHVPQFPQRGSKVEYTMELHQLGGQVASAILACQRWGLHTRYVGKLGDDATATLHEQALREQGVETHLIRVPGAASPRSLILVDAQGERTVLGYRDERVMLQPEDLQPSWLSDTRALLIDGHDTAAATLAARWARQVGASVVADIDETYPGAEELLPNIDYLIASRDFPTKLTGEPDLKTALRSIADQYGCTLTAATLGTEGVLAWDGTRFHHAAAYRVEVADTTGAGDIFHAGFLYALLNNWPLEQQLDFACAAAALNCTAQGARGGIATVESIKQLMAHNVRHECNSY